MLVLKPQRDVDVIVRWNHSGVIASIRPLHAPAVTAADGERCASRHADLRRPAQRYTPRHLTTLNQRFACRVV